MTFQNQPGQGTLLCIPAALAHLGQDTLWHSFPVPWTGHPGHSSAPCAPHSWLSQQHQGCQFNQHSAPGLLSTKGPKAGLHLPRGIHSLQLGVHGSPQSVVAPQSQGDEQEPTEVQVGCARRTWDIVLPQSRAAALGTVYPCSGSGFGLSPAVTPQQGREGREAQRGLGWKGL